VTLTTSHRPDIDGAPADTDQATEPPSVDAAVPYDTSNIISCDAATNAATMTDAVPYSFPVSTVISIPNTVADN